MDKEERRIYVWISSVGTVWNHVCIPSSYLFQPSSSVSAFSLNIFLFLFNIQRDKKREDEPVYVKDIKEPFPSLPGNANRYIISIRSSPFIIEPLAIQHLTILLLLLIPHL